VADGVVVNAGAGGATIATDEIAAQQYQRVKLISGIDGVNDGDAAASNPFPVAAQAQSPQHERLTSVALAAAANVDLTTADITTATTGKLSGVDLCASLPTRVDIQTVSGARTTQTTVFTQAGETLQYRTPHIDHITQAGGAGNGFGVSITNLDTGLATDVFATIFWEEH
jgi:hypothetical protein